MVRVTILLKCLPGGTSPCYASLQDLPGALISILVPDRVDGREGGVNRRNAGDSVGHTKC